MQRRQERRKTPQEFKPHFATLPTLRLCVKPKVAPPCPPGIAQTLSPNANRLPLTIVIVLSLLDANVTITPPAPVAPACPEHHDLFATRHRIVARATTPGATPRRDRGDRAASETPSL